MISRYGNEGEEKSRMQFLAYYIIFILSISLMASLVLILKVIVSGGL